MATATKAIKGFKVLCPECGDTDATVRIDLNRLNACSCSSCDWEGSPREAAAKLVERAKRWEAIARWTEMAGEALAGTDEELNFTV